MTAICEFTISTAVIEVHAGITDQSVCIMFRAFSNWILYSLTLKSLLSEK